MGEAVTLRVAEAFQQDIGLGTARLDVQTRQRLKVGLGDVVEIRGRKPTPAVVSRAQPDDEGKGLVRIEAVVRRNAGVSIGDRIQVQRVDCPNADSVTIAPIYAGSARMDLGPGLESFVAKALARRPFVRGDVFVIPGVFLMGGSLPFMVVATQPKGIVQVAPATLITIKEETVSESEVAAPRVSYEDIGGLKEKLGRVREMIELPLKHPELFDRLAITPPKGVLLYGPPGTGKTLIAKAVANEAGAHFIGIQGPEIISKYYGESEKELREKFEEAEKNAPSVIFIDELDSIAPRRDEVVGEVERRVVAQLLTLMDGLSGRGNVIVIAATNREEAIDPALRRPGRFDREIEIGVPTQEGRLEILQIHTRGMPIDGTEKDRERLLKELAALSHGFVGADLSSLGREAAMRALRRYLPEIDFDQPIPLSLLERMKVTENDFKEALKQIEPSSLRDVAVEIPTTHWDEVGGVERVRRILEESVELPFKNPQVYRHIGIEPPRGILLYGPPGGREDAPREGRRDREPGELHLGQGPRSDEQMGRGEREGDPDDLQEGTAGVAVDRLHRRARLDRPPARAPDVERGDGTDRQPAPHVHRRAGNARAGPRHRRDESPRHHRRGAAPHRSVRPDALRGAPNRSRSARDLEGPLPQDAARRRRRPRRPGRSHGRVRRERPRRPVSGGGTDRDPRELEGVQGHEGALRRGAEAGTGLVRPRDPEVLRGFRKAPHAGAGLAATSRSRARPSTGERAPVSPSVGGLRASYM